MYNKVKWLGREFTVRLDSYWMNERTAIILVDDKGEPFCTATVNLPNETLIDKEVCIKDYSENSGVLVALQEAGVLGNVLRTVKSGFAEIAICELFKNQ